MSPLTGPAAAEVWTLGRGLARPECVLATASGAVFVSHAGHGVARLREDGPPEPLAPPSRYGEEPILPNGIALRPDGSFLIANIADPGGIHLLEGGRIAPWLTEHEGRPMPPVNFVTTDEEGRVWFSVSSTARPRHRAYRRDVADGFVAVIERGAVRVVADGLRYANELRVDLERGCVWVAETFGGCVTRVSLARGGARETVARFEDGSFVDGIALDAEGGLWSASIVSNGVHRMTPDGRTELVLAETDPAWTAEVVRALDEGRMGREHFDRTPARTLRNVSSLAFAGPDRTTLLCGSLLGEALVAFPAGVAGVRPVHWDVEAPAGFQGATA